MRRRCWTRSTPATQEEIRLRAAHDGLGGRGRRHDPRRARAHRAARQHLHPLPRRQRLLLRRARRSGRSAASPTKRASARRSSCAIPPLVQGGQPARRARDLPGHRAHADRAGRRQAGPAGAGPLARAAAGRPAPGRLAQLVPRRVLGRERDAVAGRHDLQGGAHRAGTSSSTGSTATGLDELYDLDADPYELRNLHDEPARAPERDALRRELARLVAEALGL